ncbi:MAG: hypothetical protein IKZ46_12880 [Victivallales bacterium]|nr:hypothetical protein [Victivallales bacterium]
MSWGTYYKYHGYLIRIAKNELDEKIEECTENIERIFREILAYMAMKPPSMPKIAKMKNIRGLNTLPCR